MSILLDLILIGIVLLCGWRGFRTGIINVVCGILAIVVALYGANLLASVYYTELTDVIEPLTGGITDSAMSKVINWNESLERDDKAPLVILSDAEKKDVATLSYAVFREIGLTSSVSEELSMEVSKDVEKVNYKLSEEISECLSVRIAYVAIFIIVFLLMTIIFFVIGNIFDISFGLPGHEKLNHVTGAILGGIKGIFIIMIIGCFCRYMCLILPEKLLSGTLLLEKLTTLNKLASILGI